MIDQMIITKEEFRDWLVDVPNDSYRLFIELATEVLGHDNLHACATTQDVINEVLSSPNSLIEDAYKKVYHHRIFFSVTSMKRVLVWAVEEIEDQFH